MILKYGSYTHSQNEVALTITREPLRSQGGVYYAYKERWNCKGVLLGFTNQAQITSAINALQAAYSVDGGDLVFYLDDGVTRTAHALVAASCYGGTRVVQAPSFPDTYGTGEYQPSVGRSYSFAVEGETAIGGGNVTLQFTETLTCKGTGGPLWVYIPVAQGQWVRQQVSQQSTYTVTQKGQAVGLNGVLVPPDPIWPDAEKQEQRMIEYGSPQRYGVLQFPLSWSYTFESTGALTGTPNTGS
jgi:hypothetical protein